MLLEIQLVMGLIHTLLLTVQVAKLVEQGENCTWIFVPLEEPSEINELWGRDVLGIYICSAPLSRQEVGRVTSSSAASIHRIEAVPAVLRSSNPTQEAACYDQMHREICWTTELKCGIVADRDCPESGLGLLSKDS